VSEAEFSDQADDGMLTEVDILNIVGAELTQSSTGTYAGQLDSNREQALDYYLGELPGPAPDGRSQAVSTDVADAIEWILPQIIKELVSKGPIITFNANSEQDEEQARLESEYVHDVFMSENEGYLNLYQFVKDALMQKNGIFKITYDDTPETTTEEYTGVTEQQLEMLLADPTVEADTIDPAENPELIAAYQAAMQQFEQQMMQFQQMQMQQPPPQQGMTQQQPQQPQPPQEPPPPPDLFDVTITRTEETGKIVVECVAPENFRINEYHDSLSPADARFTAHVTLQTRSSLIEQGHDPKVIDEAPVGSTNLFRRDYRFSAQDEGSASSEESYSEDSSQDLLEVSECYMQMDIDGDGVSELVKITVLGADTPTVVLDVEPLEEIPFVSASCIIMSHKFSGLSIYDRLKQIQDQKTSLWRNVLDNLYLQNNREKEVVESQVNIDDLLISRPGGIKRVKQLGSIRELEVQPIGQEGFQMLDYLDKVRTGRVGVSPDTMGASMPVGGDTAHGVERMMSAKEELTGLMIRTVAETGVKAAYKLIRDLLVRHKDITEQFKFRGSWAEVNPSNWGKRSRTTVMVGTGTGDDMRRQAAISAVIGMQTQILDSKYAAMVPVEKAFNAYDEFCETSGLKGGENYFLDPKSEQGQQAVQSMEQNDAKMQQMQEEMQQKMTEANEKIAEGEFMKGQAALQSQQVKAQSERMKAESAQVQLMADAEIADLNAQLEQSKLMLDDAKAGSEADIKNRKITSDEQLGYAKLENDMAIKMLDVEVDSAKVLVDAGEKEKDRQAAKEQAEMGDDNSTDED